MVDRVAAALSLSDRVRPVSLASERVLEVSGPLASVLPGGALQRGITVGVGGAATSLALALAASVAGGDSWVAAVGMGSLGLAAAEESGLALERLLLVDPVPPGQWAAVVAALVEAVEVVLVAAPASSVPAGQARRVAARMREQGAVLVQVGWPERAWPQRPELSLQARPLAWSGIGAGHGHLRARQVEIAVHGRHGADRPRSARFWLPDEHGRLAPVEPEAAVTSLHPHAGRTRPPSGTRAVTRPSPSPA